MSFVSFGAGGSVSFVGANVKGKHRFTEGLTELADADAEAGMQELVEEVDTVVLGGGGAAPRGGESIGRKRADAKACDNKAGEGWVICVRCVKCEANGGGAFFAADRVALAPSERLTDSAGGPTCGDEHMLLREHKVEAVDARAWVGACGCGSVDKVRLHGLACQQALV